MNPQRQLDRLLRNRLTVAEAFKVYPRTFIAPTILVALILAAIFMDPNDGWIAAAIVYGSTIFAAAPWVFEGFYCNNSDKHRLRDKQSTMRAQRGLHRGRPRLLVVPDGELVRIHTWSPRPWGTIEHDVVEYHAGDQDRQAQEYVAEFKARDFSYGRATGPSPEAKALAKVLNP